MTRMALQVYSHSFPHSCEAIIALSALRPDAHRGSGDCLHWANRLPHWRRMEELTEAPTILLFNAIKWLRKWAESLTGSKNAPLHAGNLDIA